MGGLILLKIKQENAMQTKQQVEKLLDKIETTGILLWQQKSEGYKNVQEIVKNLGELMPQLLDFMSKYGTDDCNTEMLMSQLKRIVKDLEKRDVIELADVLNYELYNTLNFYKQNIDILKEENR